MDLFDVFRLFIGTPRPRLESSENYDIFQNGENFGSLHHLEENLQQIMKQYQELIDVNPNGEPHDKPSLRDEMLKPETNKLENNSFKLPTVRDDGMHYSTRSSSFTLQSDNSISTMTEVENDREGCRREKTTQEWNGKKYILTRRKCPGMSEQKTETLVNMTREELPEFLKHWQS